MTMEIVAWAVGAVFLASSVLACVRIIRGPSILDRMIASDVLLASIICGLGGYLALTGRTDLLPVMLTIAAFGFIASIAVSRYVQRADIRPSRSQRKRSAARRGRRGRS